MKSEKGLYNKYYVSKSNGKVVNPHADYFVLRLDKYGKDQKHVAACRKAVLYYAEEIKEHLPELSKDLIRKYGSAVKAETNHPCAPCSEKETCQPELRTKPCVLFSKSAPNESTRLGSYQRARMAFDQACIDFPWVRWSWTEKQDDGTWENVVGRKSVAFRNSQGTPPAGMGIHLPAATSRKRTY